MEEKDGDDIEEDPGICCRSDRGFGLDQRSRPGPMPKKAASNNDIIIQAGLHQQPCFDTY